MVELGIIAVGEPFDASGGALPEGCHFNFDLSGYWLHYLYNKPTPEEVKSIQSGQAQFGLYTRGPLLFLLHRFGTMNWHDAAYSWWLVGEEFRKLPEITGGFHALLKVVMIDTETGLVVALRALTFSEEFTRCLHQAILRQTLQPWTKEEHERAVRSIYAEHTTLDLVERGEIFCKGGE